MATYKVPQDVEAEDKLLGPFTFRQFVYLIVVALLGAAIWGLWQVFPPLIVLPLPFLVFFGALALPLRKDQPMETYLAAMVSFYLKPRKRIWEPDGIDSLVEISAPKTVEVNRVKDISQGEAEQRLSYLAQIVDSRGWAVRGSLAAQAMNSMNDDIYFDAQQTQDVLDANNTVARKFEYKLEQSDAKRQEEMRARMATIQPDATQPTALPPQGQSQAQTAQFNYFSAAAATPDPSVTYNPYPTDIKQAVVQPLAAQPIATPLQQSQQPQQSLQQITPQDSAIQQQTQVPIQPADQQITTSENTPAPAIMNLVNNTPELSIETIAKQANRINKEQSLSEDTIISLR